MFSYFLSQMKKGLITLVLLIILALAVTIAYFASQYTVIQENTSISSIQLFNAEWRGTIHITGDTYFPPWNQLTITPGTQILFEKEPDIENTDWVSHADAYIKDHNDPTGREGYSKTHYELYGKIIALGTADQPILFTSAQTEPEYADWDELILASDSILDHVELAYAHNGININGNNIIIKNSKIHDSLWSCIDIFSINNQIENNEIYHCWHQAIGVKVKGVNTIEQNNIHDSQLSINCEFDANPSIRKNTFKSAPLNSECPKGEDNIDKVGKYDTAGGTYERKLVYPAMD